MLLVYNHFSSCVLLETEDPPPIMQVKYTSTGPCLVEVGSRCHGGEGTWQPIAQECLGYNQVRMTVKTAYTYVAPSFLASDTRARANHSRCCPQLKSSFEATAAA